VIRTISIKLVVPEEKTLIELVDEFSKACGLAAAYAKENRCWNRVALHHLSYYKIREDTGLGSQMACNAIHRVCTSYKVLKIKKDQEVPSIIFKDGSVHYDKKTYSIREETLSLYTLSGRLKVKMLIGKQQAKWLSVGEPKEAELFKRDGSWYFNLALEIEDQSPTIDTNVLGVDLGENNIATCSSGKIFSGKRLSFNRDKFLHFRKRLQSNGSQSALQLLRKISGKEARRVKHVNHCVSKAIVEEAARTGSGVIVLEELKNIRKRIKYGKRMNSRLHRWAWHQLQLFIEYKAEGAGISIEKRSPAYTSKTCSTCDSVGSRKKHRFYCGSCANLAHSDVNAARNIARLSEFFNSDTGACKPPECSLPPSLAA
jgi:putative transposase